MPESERRMPVRAHSSEVEAVEAGCTAAAVVGHPERMGPAEFHSSHTPRKVERSKRAFRGIHLSGLGRVARPVNHNPARLWPLVSTTSCARSAQMNTPDAPYEKIYCSEPTKVECLSIHSDGVSLRSDAEPLFVTPAS